MLYCTFLTGYDIIQVQKPILEWLLRYIYNDRTPFEKLTDNYFCPVCGAPKRRFRPYAPDVSKNANSTDVRKDRKEQIKRDEAVGQALPFAIALGVAALIGLYFYLNSIV
ncbi:hypothetical protein SASPL_123158 [Salvia splendens]|uniref:Rubredoxin-like domain-containing protein n=1 Tax=Salvia splendens TaxID=180675 RepID=A0A8X8XPQ0_SALSN|nr:hypothetical protein SASPL_123158 [Salvia splendens]